MNAAPAFRAFKPALFLFFILSLGASATPLPASKAFQSNDEQPLKDHLLARGASAPDSNGDGIIDAGDLGYLKRGEVIARVNSGGPEFTDADGYFWKADSDFDTNGSTYSSSTPIEGTDLQTLYSTERFTDSGPLFLDLLVEPGRYIVRYHFAEIFHDAPGDRILDIYLENKLVFDNLDIVAAAGGANKPFVFEATQDVVDGSLSIVVDSVAENAKLSGVEVLMVRPLDENRPVIARLNAGGEDFTDFIGRQWSSDDGFFTVGETFSTATGINGTPMQSVFQTERFDGAGEPNLRYTFQVDPGLYTARLHFAEIFANGIGERQFDVWVEGQKVLPSFDILANALKFTALSYDFQREVVDGSLDIELVALQGESKISGIEVFQDERYELRTSTDLLQWPITTVGETGRRLFVTLSNPSEIPLRINQVEFSSIIGSGSEFFTVIDGQELFGAQDTQTHFVDLTIDPGRLYSLPVGFHPVEAGDNQVELRLKGNFGTEVVTLVGSGVAEGHSGFLHVVIETPPVSIDYDGDGMARVLFNGDKSHTHEFGRSIVGYDWRDENGRLIGTGPTTSGEFSVGEHTITLKIFDDNDPPKTLTGSKDFTVVDVDEIPGVLVLGYENREGGPEFLLDSVPDHADYGFVSPDLELVEMEGTIEETPYTGGVMLQLKTRVAIPSAGSYEFSTTGGTDRRLFVNGEQPSGALSLSPGLHDIEARFAVQGLGEVPLKVEMSKDGGPMQAIAQEDLSHSQSDLKPVINTMPREGISAGGSAITITGLGFFPEDQVAVNWGNTRLEGDLIEVGSDQIRLTAPPGQGIVAVTVDTPNGQSDIELYNYTDDADIPVQFDVKNVASIQEATTAAWGPDGRLYVATLNGNLEILSFDENYNVTDVQSTAGVSGLSNKNILGIAFNPTENQDPIRVYISHSQLFANGGYCFSGISPYSGQVSILEGPNFDEVKPVITGLPASNHDHGVNGLDFDHNGDLFICQGGNTNAGVEDCNIGGLPESPLSAAMLKAELTKPNFNGVITYLESATGNVNMNQADGDIVDVAPGVDVKVYGAGLRNPFDLVYTTDEKLFAVDNGSDPGFGPESTGPNSSQPAQDRLDELVLVEEGNYYGHPNRTRGRSDERQNVFHPPTEDTIPGVYTGPKSILPFSPNGLDEYRAQTFRGAMRGDLLAQVWNTELIRLVRSADGLNIDQQQLFPATFKALDVLTAPGGAIFGIDYSNNEVKVAIPDDVGVQGLTVYDITPWRAPMEAGMPFIIGGFNFGTMENTSVLIGGVSAPLTSVTPTRIKGIIPVRDSAPADLLSVAVTVGGNTVILPNAFRYLGDTIEDSGARAFVEIDPGLDIVESSTFWPNSFIVKNESTNGQNINKVTYDLRTAFLPDVVFDPDGTAGDPVGKDFTVDTSPGGSVNSTFGNPHDGGGYDVLEVTFDDFEPGDTLGFSVDVDPTSIKGAPDPGPNHSGSVSGLEMMDATVTLEFDDGTVLTTYPYRKPGSDIGAKNTAKPLDPPTPSLEVLGIQSLPATVQNAQQTIRVRGPQDAAVSLVIAEAALYTDGVPGGGFDLDPFEANTVINVDEKFATISNGEYVDIPVTLTKSNSEAGYNYIIAAIKDGDGHNGELSNTVVLQLE